MDDPCVVVSDTIIECPDRPAYGYDPKFGYQIVEKYFFQIIKHDDVFGGKKEVVVRVRSENSSGSATGFRYYWDFVVSKGDGLYVVCNRDQSRCGHRFTLADVMSDK
ncbi:MAG: hypothetical protein A2261_04270 [Candidatus Magasanikbacteria bacterium RIFOXYA2_FULL_44_8]|uniref:Uncharacterized protein n=1 Tax=Candidatus Magasanikbacteria bacterium RIFOXYA2_FULL_44_8 TaxID=1798696 RepID=A0A1F6NLD4_9BACT|nr:MAG: hypothetical protein A2261_04270 [Candidatus Magasanikbacteria bacterium RIFOXYA2_FULL_44_8]